MRILILALFGVVAISMVCGAALIIMGLDGDPAWAVLYGISLIAINIISATSLTVSYRTVSRRG